MTAIGAVVGISRVDSDPAPYEATSLFVSLIGGRSALTIRNSYATVMGSPLFTEELAAATGEDLEASSVVVTVPPETGLISVTVQAASAEQVLAISEAILPTFQVVAAKTTPDTDISTALVDVFGQPSDPVQVASTTDYLPVIAGAVIGFAVGLLAVAFWPARRRGVTTLAMAEEASGIPFRAAVPDLHEPGHTASINAHDAAYAVLRAGTDRWWRHPLRLIVVVPSQRDRRAYDLAIDLVSVAQLGGNTTLLVDADLPQGGLSDYLGQRGAHGLSDATISGGRVAAPVTTVEPGRRTSGPGGDAGVAIPLLPSGTGSNGASTAVIPSLISQIAGFDAAVAVTPPFDEHEPIAELLEAADGVLVLGVVGQTTADELASLGDLLRSMAVTERTAGALLGADRLALSLDANGVVSVG